MWFSVLESCFLPYIEASKLTDLNVEWICSGVLDANCKNVYNNVLYNSVYVYTVTQTYLPSTLAW